MFDNVTRMRNLSVTIPYIQSIIVYPSTSKYVSEMVNNIYDTETKWYYHFHLKLKLLRHASQGDGDNVSLSEPLNVLLLCLLTLYFWSGIWEGDKYAVLTFQSFLDADHLGTEVK